HILTECDLGGPRRLIGIRAERHGMRHACNGYNEKDRKGRAHVMPSHIGTISYGGTCRRPVAEKYTPAKYHPYRVRFRLAAFPEHGHRRLYADEFVCMLPASLLAKCKS